MTDPAEYIESRRSGDKVADGVGCTQALVLIVVGPPGSGKGTQCAELARILQIPHVSTGNLVREYASQFGVGIRSEIDRGVLISDELISSLLVKRISAPDCHDGFILDGFPRTLHQAQFLDRYLQQDSRPVRTKIVLELTVTRASILRRMAGRRVCPVCSCVTNIYPLSIGQDLKCPVDGANLVVRSDDRKEVVFERLETYEKHARTILSYYCRTAVIRVDGEDAADVVTRKILSAVSFVAK
jgi:adenylate kinase